MHRNRIWMRLKAYHLLYKVNICLILTVVVFASIILYVQPWVQEAVILPEILMAVFTSLLVSILVLLSEIYVAYKDGKRKKVLEDIHSFGIDHLNSDKQSILRSKLKDCQHIIWFSGYRLIMTYNLRESIADAIRRGSDGLAVVCPPWSKAYGMVYGTEEKVMRYYYEVFNSINEAKKIAKREFEIFFIDKPIFSDTYRFDSCIVTGPYMHNKDNKYNRLMAKDFFSYSLVRESDLYHLVVEEYETIKSEAYLKLDWGKFEKCYLKYKKQDLNERESRDLLLTACNAINEVDKRKI